MTEPTVPKPGDPGTRTVELFTSRGKRVCSIALPQDSHPGIVMMGDRAFAWSWRGFYQERQVERVQGHV